MDPLLCAVADKARLEARNGAEQLDYITQLVDAGAKHVRESHVLQLHYLAVHDIYPCAGQYRNALRKIVITNSPHTPPEAAFVPSQVRDALDWIERGTSKSALERAAYALWRFNWIHPFAGGNGRTSRAIAYLMVCMDAGRMLPGSLTVPTLIYEHREDYIRALRAADASVLDEGEADITQMSEFLRRMLIRQLATVIDSLSGAR